MMGRGVFEIPWNSLWGQKPIDGLEREILRKGWREVVEKWSTATQLNKYSGAETPCTVQVTWAVKL